MCVMYPTASNSQGDARVTWEEELCGFLGLEEDVLDEEQAGIKTAGRNINHLRYADGTTLWQKAKKNERAS